MGYFDSIINKHKNRREQDKLRYEQHDSDLCMLCGAYGSDKRSLFMSCFYDISEVVPEMIDLFDVEGLKDRDWYLRICKTCRGELLDHLQQWRNERVALRSVAKDHDGYVYENGDEKLIPVRLQGMVVYMTPEDYEEYKNGHY